MDFARYDCGEVLKKDGAGKEPQLLRLVVGNPLIMKEMAEAVPDAATARPRWPSPAISTQRSRL